MIYPYPAFEASTKEQKWQPLEGVKQQDMQGDGNKAAVADLIEAIEADREPVSSASSAVAALELILGAYEAQIRGRAGGFAHAAAPPIDCLERRIL